MFVEYSEAWAIASNAFADYFERIFYIKKNSRILSEAQPKEVSREYICKCICGEEMPYTKQYNDKAKSYVLKVSGNECARCGKIIPDMLTNCS